MTPSSNETNAKRSPAGESRSLSQSPILRGAFVHRMGENLDDESMAAKFWTAQGFAVDTLEKPGERFSRRPDLRLLRGGGAWAYCEVKTVWQHRWTVHILHKDREEVRNELTNKSVEERIGGDLVTAARQLRAENPDHGLLNFVMLVNRDSEASLGVLSCLLTEKPPKARRGAQARHDAKVTEEIQRFRRDVDLCLWTKPAAKGELAIEGCVLFNPSLRSFAEEIAGLRGGKLISLDSAA